MVAIELDKRDDWKALGLNNIQSAKVIAELRHFQKLLLKDEWDLKLGIGDAIYK